MKLQVATDARKFCPLSRFHYCYFNVVIYLGYWNARTQPRPHGWDNATWTEENNFQNKGISNKLVKKHQKSFYILSSYSIFSLCCSTVAVMNLDRLLKTFKILVNFLNTGGYARNVNYVGNQSMTWFAENSLAECSILVKYILSDNPYEWKYGWDCNGQKNVRPFS